VGRVPENPEIVNFPKSGAALYLQRRYLISKSKTNNSTFLTMPPSLIIENNVFDILMKKSKTKHYIHA